MSHKQHFLLSAKARTLSVRQVCEMSEEQAFELFKEVRWGSGEQFQDTTRKANMVL